MVLQNGPFVTVATALHGLRGFRMPWIATAFGCGIGTYFALPVEPSHAATAVFALAICALSLLTWISRDGVGFLYLLLAVFVFGLVAAQMRTAIVAGPVMPFRYYGAVEGRIVKIDRSASGAVRLTLDRVRLDGIAPERTPRRVRVSLHGPEGTEPRPGLRVMTTAHLSPPAGPTEPGGFDFQRHAWFDSLGALGYSRVPLLLASERAEGSAVAGARYAIAQALRNAIPEERGQVAAAIVVGDRSGIPDDVTEALRASNLAHLLAISGLHMGLLVGFVFASVRGVLALSPRIALAYPTRIWAACIALPVAVAYLALSGGGIATQRAFVMAAVMLGAVIVGRRALSMRSVAIAALIVLAWRPESLIGPGFQMSFAATGALVVAFGWLSNRDPKWRRGVIGWGIALLLSSAVAGLATGPFAAIHFNRVGQYGLLANLLAVPMMGAIVMPSLLIGLILWPLGLQELPFWCAEQGIGWIIVVAEWIAALDGSVLHLPAPSWHVLPLFGIGFVWMGAAAGRTRLYGAIPCFLAIILWAQSERPMMLVSESGGLAGIQSEGGRWLSRAKGDGFTAASWLENDGDPVSQEMAAARDRPSVAGLPSFRVVRSSAELKTILADCVAGEWIITPRVWDGDPPRCVLYDAKALSRTGALSLTGEPDGAVRVRTSRELQGQRPWVR